MNNLKIKLNESYIVEYTSLDIYGYEGYTLLCPLTRGDIQFYIPEGAPLKLIDIPNKPNTVGVSYKNKCVGYIPKEVLNNYSNKGFVRHETRYIIQNFKQYIWLKLK